MASGNFPPVPRARGMKMILPSTGDQVWQLGVRNKWSVLGLWLKEAGLERWWVIDAASESLLAQYRHLIDKAKNPAPKGLNVLCALVAPENQDTGSNLLKRLLALGADPNVQHGGAGRRILFAAVESNQIKSAEALLMCRASVEGKLPSGEGILQLAKKKVSAGVPGASNLVQSLEKIENEGFSTIAELAAWCEFWAVKNLCRRRVIRGVEAVKKFNGKDAIEWAEHHGELGLAEELRYLLHGVPTPSETRQPSEETELPMNIPAKNEQKPAIAPIKPQPIISVEKPQAPSGALVEQLQAIREGIHRFSGKIDKELGSIRSDLQSEARERENVAAQLEKLRRDHEEQFSKVQSTLDSIEPRMRRMEETLSSGVRRDEKVTNGNLAQASTNPIQRVIFDVIKDVARVAAADPSMELLEDVLDVLKKHKQKATGTSNSSGK